MRTNNPVINELTVGVTLLTKGRINLRLVNLLTGQSENIISNQVLEDGEYMFNKNMANVFPGSYSLVADMDGFVKTLNIMKL